MTSPKRTQQLSGIGEAINQYENKSDPNSTNSVLVSSMLSSQQPILPAFREPRAFTRVKKAFGTKNAMQYSRSTSMSHMGNMGNIQEVSSQIVPNQLDVTQHTTFYTPSTPLEIPILSKSMQSYDKNYTGQVSGT